MKTPSELFSKLYNVSCKAQSIKDTLEPIAYGFEDIELIELSELLEVAETLELMKDELYLVIETLKGDREE